MRNRGRLFLERNFHLVLSNHWSGERRTQQVLVLIHRAGRDRRKDILGEELLTHIAHDNFRGASLVRLDDH